MDKGQRKKKFVRDENVAISLQKRDVAICSWVYKYRLLNTDHIVALLGDSRRVIQTRLNKLYHAGFLDRVREANTIQNTPMVYGLGKKGADTLSEKFGIVFPKNDWGRKNRELKDRYIQHTLNVNEVLVTLRLACREREDVDFIDESELLKQRPIKSNSDMQALKWPVIVNAGEFGQAKNINLGVIPDAAFALRSRGEDGKSKVSFFFLEIDRSTMPVKRENLFQTSFYKKLVGYITSYKHGLFAKYWGFKSVRILTTTKSNDRLLNILNLNKEVFIENNPQWIKDFKSDKEVLFKEAGYRLFCFTNINIIATTKPEKILGKIWIDGKGNAISLLD